MVREVVALLIEVKKTIAVMESCTGGGICNAITNVEGSSEIFSFGAVTYSNEAKIKMGLDPKIIEQNSVYSIQVANAMSKLICQINNANYGIGVTGKLNRIDKNNLYGEDNIVYVSIYDRDHDKYLEKEVKVLEEDRSQNKDLIIDVISKELLKLLRN